MMEVRFIEDKRRVSDLREFEKQFIAIVVKFYCIMSLARARQGQLNIPHFTGKYIRRDLINFFWNKGPDLQGISVDEQQRILCLMQVSPVSGPRLQQPRVFSSEVY